jgi:PEP-CTERM motif
VINMAMLRNSVCGFALLMAFGASAHASIIANTLDGSTIDTPQSVSSKAKAESFLATTTGIGDIEVDLQKTGGTGSIVITLNNNNISVPGSVVATIATITATSIPSSETLYDFYNLPIGGLTIGTTYWIEISHTGSSANAETFTDTTATPTGSGLTYWSGSGAATSLAFMTVCVSSDNACDGDSPTGSFAFNESISAPEPASLAIVGAGTAGLGWVRRRRATNPKQPSSD